MKLLYNILLVLIGIFFSITMQGQAGDFEKRKNKSSQTFEDFKKKQTEKFESYKRKKQLEFAKFLEEKWKEFELFAGKESPQLPEPVDPPVANPTDTIPDVEVPTLPVVVLPPEEEVIPIPDTPVIPEDVVYNKIAVKFAGHELTVNYDKTFNIALPQITEDKIAGYWTTLAKGSFEELIYQCFLIKKELKLNDWGYYLFVKELANNIYLSDQKNEKIAFIAFVLDNSGYKVRMGRDENYKNLVLMLAVEDQVYLKSYFIFSGKNYYLVEGNISSSVYTYNEWQEDSRKKAMHLVINESFKMADYNQTKSIKNQIWEDVVEIKYNPQLKEFYNQMPACDLSVFFNSECSEEVSNSLKTQLGKRLAGKSKKEQVSELLSFIHQGFPYMTDDNQFGREKFFFYEETFIYPYSDCEDNSILFAYLVRKLTGLKIVGLLYYDHAATAVKFDEETEGSYILHKGEKYTICDPTYIGARIGQCMPQYLNESAQIIEIK